MGAEMTSRKHEHDPDNGRDPEGDQWPCVVSGEWAGKQHLQGYQGREETQLDCVVNML